MRCYVPVLKTTSTYCFLPQGRRAVLLRAQAPAGRWSAGQYEVLGCLAHGGLGWIYLPRDRNVGDRWVVLKGLLDTGDADAHGRRRRRAAVPRRGRPPEHRQDLQLRQHPDATATGRLHRHGVRRRRRRCKELLEARRRPDGRADPLPVAQAIAYALEMLPALGYLHGAGPAYCDFKPDNVIQYDRAAQADRPRRGAPDRRRGQRRSTAPSATRPRRSPRTARRWPRTSTPSAARSPCWRSASRPPARTWRRRLPQPADHPGARHATSRCTGCCCGATDPDPDARFASADEMAEQLAGVLREVARRRGRAAAARAVDAVRGAARRVRRRPASARRGPAGPIPRGWPRRCRCRWSTPPTRPRRCSPPRAATRRARIAARWRSPAPEVRLRAGAGRARPPATRRPPPASSTPRPPTTRTTGGSTGTAGSPHSSPAPRRRPSAAFDRVYATLPGELAPKLALAVAAECAGDDDRAAPLVRAGLADRPELRRRRVRAGPGRAAGRRPRGGRRARSTPVPDSSSHTSPRSSRRSTRRSPGRTGAELGEADLRAAAAACSSDCRSTSAAAEHVRAALLAAAVGWSTGERPADRQRRAAAGHPLAGT